MLARGEFSEKNFAAIFSHRYLNTGIGTRPPKAVFSGATVLKARNFFIFTLYYFYWAIFRARPPPFRINPLLLSPLETKKENYSVRVTLLFGREFVLNLP